MAQWRKPEWRNGRRTRRSSKPVTSETSGATEEERARDDGRPWGFIDNGVFIALPKLPLLRANLGPPPFEVSLPDTRVRAVVHDPNEGLK
jgi:hypothetical protein